MTRPAWADGRLMSFDTETTGTDPETARLVTAALLFLGGDGTREDHYWLVNSGVDIPAEATAVHGITTERAELEGIDPDVAVPGIVYALNYGFDQGWPLVVYNAPYDLTLLAREVERMYVNDPRIGVVIDPLVIDKAIDPYRRGSRKLVDVAAHYGVAEDGNAHNAAADALMAARVAVAMSDHPAIRGLSLPELHAAQIGWRASQAESFENYLRGQGKADVIRREWPLLPKAVAL